MSNGIDFRGVPPTLGPGEYPLPGGLDPAAALTFRTPLQEHPPAADTKAGSIITLSGIMFTVLAKFAPNLESIFTRGGWEKWLALALLSAFAIITVYAVIHAFQTIAPRFPKAPPSLAFYGDIAKLSRQDYVEKVKSLSAEEALHQMLDYNYTVSAICVEKFRQLRMGMKAFKVAFPLWALLMTLIIMDEVIHGDR